MAFNEKDPTEVVTLTFDFTDEMLGETLVGTPVLTVTTVRGFDPSPTAILIGVPSVVNSLRNYVLQGVQGGIAGSSYDVKCIVLTSGNRKLALSGLLPIVAI